jgi:hypothetical protein
MDERILKSLFDIKLAIEEIDSFLLNEEKTFSNYTKKHFIKKRD